MSILNKVISGKRVNYAQRGGYYNRCHAAVFAYNHGSLWSGKIFLRNASPCSIWKKPLKEAETPVSTKKKPSKKWHNKSVKTLKYNSRDYGLNPDTGSMNYEELAFATAHLIKSLQVSPEERNKIERDTVNQCFSEDWKYQRRNRITASKAGRVYS